MGAGHNKVPKAGKAHSKRQISLSISLCSRLIIHAQWRIQGQSGRSPIQTVNGTCPPSPSRQRIVHGLVGIGQFIVHIRHYKLPNAHHPMQNSLPAGWGGGQVPLTVWMGLRPDCPWLEYIGL